MVPVTVRRDLDDQHFELNPIESCNFRVVVLEDADLRLENRGTNVLISNVLIDLTHSDDEIKMLIAHQLAHIFSEHGTKKTRNAAIGGVAGGAAATALLLPVAIVGAIAGEDVEFIGDAIEGSARLSCEAGGGMFALRYEREADYLAIYLLERAGVEASDYLTFWDRMPSDAVLNTMDKRIEDRAANIAATIEEIDEKRVAGLTLVPNQELKPFSDE